MTCKPDLQYLKQSELDYSISLEKYHIACNSINDLKTILSVLVSAVGILLSLILPVLLDKNQFLSFISVKPEMYPPLLISLSIIILFIVACGSFIIVTLFRDNSSSLFDIEVNNQNLSHLSLLTRYKRLTQKLEEITEMISYKQNIYSRTLSMLCITSFLVMTITLIFLNGLGSGEGSLNILLNAFTSSFTAINTIPTVIWVVVTLSLVFNLFGFAYTIVPVANIRRFDKKQHKICVVIYKLSIGFYVTLIIFSVLAITYPELSLMMIINAGILMMLPYGMNVLLTCYLLKAIHDLKKEKKSEAHQNSITL